VTDTGGGTYSVSFTPTRAAQWQVFIQVVDGRENILNGLTAQYFNNRWLQAPAVITRVDKYINFLYALVIRIKQICDAVGYDG
jgi:hypothetical protein